MKIGTKGVGDILLVKCMAFSANFLNRLSCFATVYQKHVWASVIG